MREALPDLLQPPFDTPEVDGQFRLGITARGYFGLDAIKLNQGVFVAGLPVVEAGNPLSRKSLTSFQSGCVSSNQARMSFS